MRLVVATRNSAAEEDVASRRRTCALSQITRWLFFLVRAFEDDEKHRAAAAMNTVRLSAQKSSPLAR